MSKYKIYCIKKSLYLFFLILFMISHGFPVAGQNTDSITGSRSLLRKSVVPATLISSALLLNGSAFEKELQTSLRNSVGKDFYSPVDNYLQYVPAVEIYIADLAGIQSRNHWFDQTKYLLISVITSSLITQGIKHINGKTRPSGSDDSFPSGHTTMAFTNATVLFREFSDTSPWIAYSGYIFAATTGTFRLLNNKHWLSDVLMGAGIGIAVTQIVYHLEPLKNFNPFKKIRNLVLVPQADNRQYGLYLSYRF